MKATVMILNLIKSNGKNFPLFLFALCFFGFQAISAQTTKVEPKPTVVATPAPEAPPKPRRMPTPRRLPEAKKVVINESETPAEKAIMVEPKVNITVCVTEGNVKINGWDRDEVRAMVSDGSEVGFKVAQKNLKTGKAEWIFVQGFDAAKTREIRPDECLMGSEIELDVPRGATVKLKSRESEIQIGSVAKVGVENGGGNIYLNDIERGITAVTYAGGITVEKSSGSISLTTTSGNIVAIDVSPSDIGDIFKAKTNSGMITLNDVVHRQIDTTSISGSTSFAGAIIDGGQYGFGTQNGTIVLAIPANSSCKINAVFSFGAFASELPLLNALKKEQSLSAQIGQGAATLNLRTVSGAIRIRKQE